MRNVLILLICCSSALAGTVVITPGLHKPEFISITLDQCVISPRKFVLIPMQTRLIAYGDHRAACIVPGGSEKVTLDTLFDCLAPNDCSGDFTSFELRISNEPGCRIGQQDNGAMVVPDCVFRAPRVNYQRFPVRDVARPLVYGVYHGRMNDVTGTFQFSETLTAAVTRAGDSLRVELNAVGAKQDSEAHASFRQFQWVADSQPVVTTLFSGTQGRIFSQQLIGGIKITESNGASVILAQLDSKGRQLHSIMSDTETAVDPRRIPGRFRMHGDDRFTIREFELKRCIEQRTRDATFVSSLECPIHREGKAVGQLHCWAPTNVSGMIVGGNACDLVIHGSTGVLVKRMHEWMFALDAWYNEDERDPEREYVINSIPFALRTE